MIMRALAGSLSLPTYLFAYLSPTYLPTWLPLHLPTYLPTALHPFLPTALLHFFSTFLPIAFWICNLGILGMYWKS